MLTSDKALAIAIQWLEKVGAARDAQEFANQVLAAGWLRDLLCFSWDFRTLSGRENIAAFLSQSDQTSGGKTRFAHAGLHDFKIDATSTLGPPERFTPPKNPAAEGVAGAFTFAITSPPAVGRGYFRLLQDADDGEWRANTLFINMHDLKGHEEPSERPEGHLYTTWQDVHAQKIADIERDPTVLILGAGHSGLMCAARLGRMGIRTLVVEKTARVGDVWRNRYSNLSLHTPSYQCTILYHPWPHTYPKFLPKDKIADFLEAYAIGQEIHVWNSSQFVSKPVYDDSTGRWSVDVDHAGTRVTLTPRHIVLAMGTMGKPRIPTWPGMESFLGSIYHSDYHKGAGQFKGKRIVVVGAGNASGDICLDFVMNGASEVTMVQRSATCVLGVSSAEKIIFKPSYPPYRAAEDADFVVESTPPALALKLAPGLTQRLKDLDQQLIEGLAKAGMKMTWELTPGGEEVGALGFFLNRSASGTMLDMGCGQLIIDGKLRYLPELNFILAVTQTAQVKQGVEIERMERNGIIFRDGSKIEADVIVLATGYTSNIDNAMSIFGDTIKERVGSKIYLADEEGEMSRCFRPSGVPKLWFALGGFPKLRFFSKHLAIQILAEELGLKV